MNTTSLKLSQVKTNKANPRTISKDKFQKLVNSLLVFPEMLAIRPVVVDGQLTALGGNMRLNALQAIAKMSLDEVAQRLASTPEYAASAHDEKQRLVEYWGNWLQSPTVAVIDGSTLTESERRQFIIKDNVSFGQWDYDALANDWDTPQLEDWGLDLWNWDGSHAESGTQDDEGKIKTGTSVEDDFSDDEEKKVEERVKKGEIWQLGNHRLMCGDSIDLEQVKQLLGGVNVDMLFTDPPYNVAFNGRSGKFDVIENDNLSNADFTTFIKRVISVIKALNLKTYYIWCNWKFYGLLQQNLEFKNCIVWAKNVFGMGKGYRHQHEFCLFNGMIDPDITNESDLWEIAKDTNYIDPTQKPTALCTRALNNHRKVKNVLDLFGGSGSTLMACEMHHCNCFTMELDPHYCSVIISRWERLTGKIATKIDHERRPE